jgi:ribosomal protein S18 acetylase RimI-like enzyme
MNDAIHGIEMSIDGKKWTRFLWIIPQVTHQQPSLLGCVDVQCRGKVAYLRQLYVHRGYRTHGIGRALVEACIETAQKTAAKSISLMVQRKNADAQAFYRRLGFVFSHEDEDDFIMSKEIK